MKKLIIGCLLGCSAIAFADPAAEFTMNHAPIAPACVAEFDDALVSTPYTTALNLDSCQKSHAADPSVPTKISGNYAFYHHNDKSGSFGTYGYHVIGKTKNGVFVVETYSSGGGSGTYTHLALLKIDNGHLFSTTQLSEMPKNQPFTRLSILGEIEGGDRCFGDLTDIQLKGNQLSFKQYHGKTAVDCVNPKAYTVDLSKLN